MLHVHYWEETKGIVLVLLVEGVGVGGVSSFVVVVNTVIHGDGDGGGANVLSF